MLVQGHHDLRAVSHSNWYCRISQGPRFGNSSWAIITFNRTIPYLWAFYDTMHLLKHAVTLVVLKTPFDSPHQHSQLKWRIGTQYHHPYPISLLPPVSTDDKCCDLSTVDVEELATHECSIEPFDAYTEHIKTPSPETRNHHLKTDWTTCNWSSKLAYAAVSLSYFYSPIIRWRRTQ